MKFLLYPLLLTTTVCLAQDATTAPDTTTTETAAPTCTGNGDCAETEFCGTDGACLELTCLNWSQYAGSDADKYDDTTCENKGEEFCGRDGNCHPYNCENWYKQGPAQWTGYDESNAVELTCQDYPKDVATETNANGLVFSCKKFPPGKPTPQTKAVPMVFNQHCFAEPQANHDFDCYQYAEGTSFNDYQNDIARLNLNIPPKCEGAGQPNSPVYWYQITLKQTRPGVEETMDVGPENTSSFSLPDAYKAMYATMTSDVAEPGAAPMADGTNSMSGGDARIQHKMEALLLAAIGWLLI